MTDRYAKKRAAILSKHWRDAWHLRADGRLLIRNTQTGAIIDAGHIDPGPHKPPVAYPRIEETK